MEKDCCVFEVSRIYTIQGFRFIYVPLSGFEQSLRTEYTGDADWATHHDGDRISPESKYLLLYIFSPEGKPVIDAVVCSTVIGPEADIRTARVPFRLGGYAIDLKGRTTGVLRIEIKIEIASQLLTDEFSL